MKKFDSQGKSKKKIDTIKTVKNNNIRFVQQACIKDAERSVLDRKEKYNGKMERIWSRNSSNVQSSR